MARVVSIPLAFVHILDQLRCIRDAGIDVDLVSSPDPLIEKTQAYTGLPFVPVTIPREIRPTADIVALWRLTRLFRAKGYDIVHSSTPKAGIIGMLAAWFARVPVRLHTFTGQRWVTTCGLLRTVLRACDRLTVALATQVYTDSPSQRDFLVAEGIVSSGKIRVIHRGCMGGIDPERFSREKFLDQTTALMTEYGMKRNSVKLVFLGRVTRDKGIVELVDAFVSLHEQHPDVELILVGPYEPNLDPVPPRAVGLIDGHEAIHAVGFCSNPQRFLALGDIFCIPSYREGFGTVVIEAAAMELPAVGTRIPGLVDSIAEGETGLLVEKANTEALREGLRRLVDDAGLRTSMGRAAHERAIRDFGYQIIARDVIADYRALTGVEEV